MKNYIIDFEKKKEGKKEKKTLTNEKGRKNINNRLKNDKKKKIKKLII